MNIIDMELQIFLITNLMLPKSALPNASLPLTIARRTLVVFGAAGTKIPTAKTSFDTGSSQGEIAITPWKFPYAVQMIG